MRCPNCGTENPEGTPTCSNCQAPLAATFPVASAPREPTIISTTPSTSNMAVASLILGILGCSFLFLIASIPAIICGHIALREINRSHGQIEGKGYAQAGLVLGYLAVGLTIVGYLLFGAFLATLCGFSGAR
jgi:hypothetical protein